MFCRLRFRQSPRTFEQLQQHCAQDTQPPQGVRMEHAKRTGLYNFCADYNRYIRIRQVLDLCMYVYVSSSW